MLLNTLESMIEQTHLLPHKSQGSLDIRWDVSMLNKIIGYVFKKSKNINNLNLRNVQLTDEDTIF